MPTSKAADRRSRRFDAMPNSLLDGSAAAGLDALGSDDAVGRINGSFVRDGYVIDVPDGTELDNAARNPVHPCRRPDPYAACRCPSAPMSRRPSSSVTSAVTGDAALVSHVSDITVGEGTELTWIILQQQGGEDTHLGQIRIDLGADAKLKLFVINAGGKLVRQELHIKVTGEGADLTLRGINLLGGDTPYRRDDGARPRRAEYRLDGSRSATSSSTAPRASSRA